MTQANPLSEMRYRNYKDRDTQAASDGDALFTGVNAKLAPELLQPGWVHAATNVRFRHGRAETREGSLQVYPPTGANAFYASGLYSDPDGDEWILLASESGSVIQWRHGHTPRTIAVPAALASGAALHFVQAFGSVLYFRGNDAVPWQWAGGTRDDFMEIDQIASVDDTVPIPNGSDVPGLRPVLMGNRLFVPYSRDRIAVSQILDFTRYDAAFDDFNVNDGSDDRLTALYPFSNNTLLVFKDQSTFAISNIFGDLSTVRLDQINHEVGCAAGRTVASVGGDVFWLGAGGVYRLHQVVQERLETAPVPVSDPIAPIIARINGRAIGRATAAVVGEYYYLAVPLDGSTGNNAILAFNTVSGAWEGTHVFPFAIDALHVTDYRGQKALYAIEEDPGRVILLYVGRSDVVKTSDAFVESEIAFRLETRGYGLGDNGVKQFRRAQLSLETWRPRYSVSLAADGVEELTTLATARPTSRTAYSVHARAPYVATNASDDHAARDREDYAWLLTDLAQLRTTGIVPERVQASLPRFTVRQPARFASLIVTADQGTIALTSTEVEGDAARRAQTVPL